ADPLQQHGHQDRVVFDGQRSAGPPALVIDGHRHVNVLVRVDPHCHHWRVLLSVIADDGTDARALVRGQTYCELTAQQASIKSLPARAPALRGTGDMPTESPADTCSLSHPAPLPKRLPSKKPGASKSAPIGVLVGAAPPRAGRVAEVDRDVGGEGEGAAGGHLGALAPGQ